MVIALLGIISGLALGLTGGGGSLFAIPLLVYGLGLSLSSSITLSLFAVTGIALVGVIQRLRIGQIEVRAGVIMALAGFVTSPAGAWAGQRTPDYLLFGLFGALTLFIAASMWRNALANPEDAKAVRSGNLQSDQESAVCRIDPNGKLRFNQRCTYALMFAGVLTGILSGLFGVGGGFLIVPALMLTTRMSIQKAVATSLLVIAIVSTAALASNVLVSPLPDTSLILLFLAGGIVGLTLGGRIANRISGPNLQKIFATLLMTAGGFMFLKEFIFQLSHA